MFENDFLAKGNYKTESPFLFSRHSSIGCGGRAKLAVYPRSAEQLVKLIVWLEEEGEPYYIVGNMTNILPTDFETQKVIVCTKELEEVCVLKDGIYALAGVSSGKLLKACRRFCKSGLEFLAGIPCTVGGALYMNAGAAGIYVSEFLESVTVIRNGKLLSISANKCEYSYKHSVFMKNRDVIVGGKFVLKTASEKEIEDRIDYFLARRERLPKGKSMGCVFKNPKEGFAGEYIEKSGLKGLRLGDARVSEKHANFIINDGKATATEIKMLIEFIKNAVYAQYKVQLQEEIEYLT